MDIAPRTIARSIAAMMLLAAVLAVIGVFRELKISPDISYNSLFLLFLYFVPLFLPVVGAVSLFTSRRFGYIFVYIGFALSVFGFYWLYVPFIPLPMEPLYLIIAVMLGANGLIVCILAWCHTKERHHDFAQNAV